jgi:hypothetical protein
MSGRPTSTTDPLNARPTAGTDALNARPTAGAGPRSARPTAGAGPRSGWPTAGAGALRLTALEFLAAWDALDLGDPPFLLGLRRPAGTREEIHDARRELTAALDNLTARGHADAGRPSPTLTTMLDILARAEQHLDLRYGGTGTPAVLTLGARHGDHGVMLIGPDDAPARTARYELRLLDATRVDTTMLARLGPLTPARAVAINLPTDLFDQALADLPEPTPWALADRLRELALPPADASALARLLAPATFGGQLGVTHRHDHRDRRAPSVITFTRIDTGHVMHLRDTDTLTITPADAPRLLRTWRSLTHPTTPPTH